jgi:hypothetical protein
MPRADCGRPTSAVICGIERAGRAWSKRNATRPATRERRSAAAECRRYGVLPVLSREHLSRIVASFFSGPGGVVRNRSADSTI